MKFLEIHVPVFNESHNLHAFFNSLIEQSFNDVDYVFHDNNSTDSSLEIIKHYANKDSRIHFRSYLQNTGPIDQMYRVSYMARNSKYIGMRSANDLMDSKYIECVINILESDQAVGLAYSHGKCIGAVDGSLSHNEFSKIDTRGKGVLESAVEVMSKYTFSFPLWGIFRSDIFSKLQPYRYSHGGDHILVCEAGLYANIASTEEVLDTRYDAPTQSGYDGVLKNAQSQMEEHLRGVSVESFFYGMKHLQPFSDMIFGHIEMFSMSKISELNKYQLCELAISVLGQRFFPLIQHENKVFLDFLDRSIMAIVEQKISLPRGVFNLWASKAHKELQKILLLGVVDRNLILDFRMRLDKL